MTAAIYWPIISLAAVTIAVWIVLFHRRVAEMKSRRINPKSVATQAQGN